MVIVSLKENEIFKKNEKYEHAILHVHWNTRKKNVRESAQKFSRIREEILTCEIHFVIFYHNACISNNEKKNYRYPR